jgi:hypothetical protein
MQPPRRLLRNAPLGVSPPIVRQWSRCVWVIIRWQTAGTDNFPYHNGVIAAVMDTVGGALKPGQRAVDQRGATEGARRMRDVSELTQQVSTAVREVLSERFLVDRQQRQAPVLGFDDRTVEATRFADTHQHQGRLQGDRADGGGRHCVLDPVMECCRDGHSRCEVAHDVAQRIRRTWNTVSSVRRSLRVRGPF